MKIKCNFNEKTYPAKPSAIATVQKELSTPGDIELSKLADSLGHGANFRPAAVNGTRSSGFISQQVFAIDIDNEFRDRDGHMKALPGDKQITPKTALALAEKNGYLPVFGYRTHSWSSSLEKFRLVFVLDKPVISDIDRNTVLKIIQKPFLTVPGWTDPVVKDKARIFFGGHYGLLMYDESNIISTSKILAEKEDLPSLPSHSSRKKAPASDMFTSQDVDFGVLSALRNHDANFFIHKLHPAQNTFNSKSDLYFWILHSLPLDQLLGVQAQKNFRCILHDDHHPSASIFIDSHGIWRYHCFSTSCGADYNAKELIEKVGGFQSEYDAVQFICKIFNLRVVENQQMVRQKENIDLIIHHMLSKDGDAFSVLCPTADKTTRTARSMFLQILTIARQTISPEGLESEPGSILFYMSLKQLMRQCNTASKSTVNQRLKVLLYHRMIIAVPDQDLPREVLAAALRNRTSTSHNHISFYKIPSYVVGQMQMIESRGKRWKEHRYRVASISYELVYREDPKIAAEMYPQTKDVMEDSEIVQRKPSKCQEKYYDDVLQVTTGLIADNGYATESQIIDELCRRGYRYRTAKLAVQRDIADICTANLLMRRRAGKKEKEYFGLDCQGYPIIIYQQD